LFIVAATFSCIEPVLCYRGALTNQEGVTMTTEHLMNELETAFHDVCDSTDGFCSTAAERFERAYKQARQVMGIARSCDFEMNWLSGFGEPVSRSGTCEATQ
jgi:hypothetical protein